MEIIITILGCFTLALIIVALPAICASYITWHFSESGEKTTEEKDTFCKISAWLIVLTILELLIIFFYLTTQIGI